MEIFYVGLLTFFLNIPFGYLRKFTNKFTFCWFLSIHAPVPFVIWIRGSFGIDLTWSLVPVLFGSFFLGQFTGRYLNRAAPKPKKEKFAFFGCSDKVQPES